MNIIPVEDIKKMLAVILSEQSGTKMEKVEAWLDTVKTHEDFFESSPYGLKEYKNHVNSIEHEYTRAVQKSKI